MKKIFNIAMLLAAALAFTGCAGEEDDLFDQSAAERLNAAKVRYTDLFSSSEAGWAMEYYPSMETYTPSDDYNIKSLGYLMLVDFDKDGSVKVGMNNWVTDNVYEEATSLWEVIADNGPVLTFSTYNENLHFFSDPAIFETGLGLEGDYEFVIVDAKADNDYAMLKGKKRGTYNLLTKLPAGTDFKTYLDDVNAFQTSLFAEEDTINYALLHFGDEVMQVRGMGSTMPNIYPYGLDQVAYESYHPGLMTKRGDKYVFRFREAYQKEGFNDVQVLVYDEASDKFVAEEDERVVLTGANPNVFFADALRNNHKWAVNQKSLSPVMATALDELKATAATLNYTFKTIEFNKVDADGNAVLELVFTTTRKVNGRNQTITAKTSYLFKLENTDENVTLTYIKPADADSETAATNIPSIVPFLNTLSDAYSVSVNKTAFKIDNVRLAKTSNAEFWFDATFSEK